jgi:hypothetical protein
VLTQDCCYIAFSTSSGVASKSSRGLLKLFEFQFILTTLLYFLTLPYRNINADFRAFAVDYWPSDSPPDYKCLCYFDLPGQMPPYYGYNPPRASESEEKGSGTIVKKDSSGDYFCYKWNGTSGGSGGSCPVGHPPCIMASDCPSGSVFSHRVDNCCASLGSKSAKKSKSAKRV